MIHLVTANSFSPADSGIFYLIVALIASLALPITFYVLRSIGIFSLAKRGGVKHAWLAWLPCVWLFVACKLIKETKIFGSTFGKMALIFTIVFALSQLLYYINEFFVYFPIVGNILHNKSNVYIVLEQTNLLPNNVSAYKFISGVYVDNSFVYPYKDLFAIARTMTIISYVSMIFELASLIITISLYINLFRKYWPSQFVLVSILSIMGLFGVFAFIIRKKQPINYADYVRSRYASYYGGQGYGPYGGPHNGPYGGAQGPYGGYGGQGAPKQPDEPFTDYQDPKDRQPDEPFSDF